MRAKWRTIAITVALFAASVYGLRFVEQQFFPTSTWTEILVDVNERANALIAKTDADIAAIERMLASEKDALFWTSYVGRRPRFILSMDLPTPGPYLGQIVIQTPDLAARDRAQGPAA